MGSIDHENSPIWQRSYWEPYYDRDYYSREGSFSGNAETSNLYSSYGSATYSPKSTDFVMPGNGVPYKEDFNVYHYAP